MSDPGAKRDVHWLNADGKVACNPRDREAAHRAAQGKLLVAEDASGVTCHDCRKRLLQSRRRNAT